MLVQWDKCNCQTVACRAITDQVLTCQTTMSDGVPMSYPESDYPYSASDSPHARMRADLQEKTSFFVCILILLLLLSSCSSREASDRPRTYPVTGVVTYQGNPVEGATVTFIGEKYSATGRTDSQGRYKLTTFQAGDGAVPGDYQVTIMKMAAPNYKDDESQEPSGDETGEEPNVQRPTPQIPVQYANPQTSHLRAKVLPESNQLDFPLK
jgi:hypothetical protein